MTWTWQQSTGTLTRDGKAVATGHAGFGNGRNNPHAQDRKFVGPLPCGNYAIGPLIEDGGSLGKHVMALTPAPHNGMFGRDDFFIHGDCAVSHGCIVLDLNTRLLIAASNDSVLAVIE